MVCYLTFWFLNVKGSLKFASCNIDGIDATDGNKDLHNDLCVKHNIFWFLISERLSTS